MSKSKNNYSVLIQVQNQNESERLISAFRSAGVTIRAHRVTSEQDIKESIANNGWDILVVDNRHPELTIQTSLDILKKKACDIPLLLITDDMSEKMKEQAFKMGIQDIVEKKDEKHFVNAAVREMDNARSRRLCRQLTDDYQELQARAEKLMAESDDAIAFVSDGILIQVNDIFADAFGFTADELDCASIIDLVAGSDQDKFKNFFRHFSKSDEEQAELSFKGLKKDKQEFEAFMTLSASTVDGEPCTQVNIATSAQSGSGAGSGTVDAASELYNRYYLAEQITSTALQIGKGISSASLMLYQFDGYERLLDDVCFSGMDYLAGDLAGLLQKKLDEGDMVARLSHDIIAVIIRKPTDKALKFAKESLKSIEEHICELDNRTVQYTCTCTVLQLNSKDSGLMIDNAIEGLAAQRLSKEKNSAGIFTPTVRKKASPGANDVSNMDEAIEQGCFKLLYQPMMSLQGEETENYEVSAWFNDGGNDIYPTDLIRAAGNSKLDRWIILEATKALAMKRAEGHNTRLLINLTVNALLDNSIPAWLGVATKAANLSTDLLIFQFSEADVKNNLKTAIKVITALHKAGFKVSIGQFGNEEEPFKLLKHIKLDLVKMDSQYTQSISSGDTEKLKNLINEAKENSVQTIIPDVDNAGALATLWQLGTHFIHGSYLQAPSPAMDYEFAEIA